MPVIAFSSGLLALVASALSIGLPLVVVIPLVLFVGIAGLLHYWKQKKSDIYKAVASKIAEENPLALCHWLFKEWKRLVDGFYGSALRSWRSYGVRWTIAFYYPLLFLAISYVITGDHMLFHLAFFPQEESVWLRLFGLVFVVVAAALLFLIAVRSRSIAVWLTQTVMKKFGDNWSWLEDAIAIAVSVALCSFTPEQCCSIFSSWLDRC